MPIGTQPDLCEAGLWWDAVRVNEAEGRRALDFLRSTGAPVGPVILDDGGIEPRMYFLVPPGTVTKWVDGGSVPLGRRSHVVVPPATRTEPPGLHWLHFPRSPKSALTSVNTLRIALEHARHPHPAVPGDGDAIPETNAAEGD
ncbi:hypothetical protein AB0M29_10790 [Streptomyces sp. NPDC051976]|uniref:hypothetical protein n=1 Tax=Streptomyces sp. NPDC051976 TaxID=3154947 RepID=UPI00343890C7